MDGSAQETLRSSEEENSTLSTEKRYEKQTNYLFHQSTHIFQEIFKYKGLQIAPAELEGLLDTHPLIQEAAVVGLPKQGVGELPRAYVVADPSKISEEKIKAFVASRAAPYKQLRGGVVFVKELPKNAIGKILRRELREQAKAEVQTSKL